MIVSRSSAGTAEDDDAAMWGCETRGCWQVSENIGRDEQQSPPFPVSAIAGITGWVRKTDEPYSRGKQAHQGDGNENQLCVCMYVWWGSSMKA